MGKCLYAPKTQRRRKHEVPLLTHGATFEREGIPDVLSPDGYNIAWRDYQQFLVDKLNQLTARMYNLNSFNVAHNITDINRVIIETREENTPTKDLLLKYARDPGHAALFNYASAAHNNHFFFSTLIDSSFSSLPTLRSHFLSTADSMFGPGYVWLVKRTQPTLNEQMQLSILATYNAGSPYPGAHFRLQPLDMNTANTGVTADMSPVEYARMMKGEKGAYPVDERLKPYATGLGTGNPNSPIQAVNQGTAGAFGAYSPTNQNSTLFSQKRAPGGASLEVLLGVSTWQHVWLRDWGIAGKRRFLEAWWEKIDWEVVFERYGKSKRIS
ncbi:MAG: hypothetical protein Q9170_000023 [Blastenia crenularia]